MRSILRKQNIADGFSLFRIVSAPFLAVYLERSPLNAIIVSTFVCLTDLLDGIAARRFGSNPWGSSLDAFSDKWVFVWFCVPLMNHPDGLSLYTLLLIMWRENTATLLRLYGTKFSMPLQTSFFAKTKSAMLPLTQCAWHLELRVPGFRGWGAVILAVFVCMTAVIAVVRCQKNHFQYSDPRAGLYPTLLGLPLGFLGFHLPISTAITLTQLYFTFGSLALYLYSGGARCVLHQWWERERVGVKVATLFVSSGVLVCVAALCSSTWTAACVLSGNQLLIFLVDCTHLL